MNMPMQTLVPGWLTPVAWTFITLSLLSAAFIAADIAAGRRRLRVAAALVWITSAFYLGPFAIAVYWRYGRARSQEAVVADVEASRKREASAMDVLPGGGASAVAHLVAVPLVAAVGWTIAGLAMWAMVVVILVLVAVMLAIYERVTRCAALGSAIAAALITVVAFDVGMVGWMLVLHTNSLMPPVTTGAFWFLMQIGILIGLVTGYPAVKWLSSRSRSAALA